MQISRRVTNGLAWAGVALVVGIPAIDAVTGRFAEPQAEQVSLVTGPSDAAAPTPAARPQPAPESAAATPAQPAAVETASAGAGDAVDTFIQSGRPLPSYISDAPAQTASTPEPATPATPAPSQTAATPPASQPATPPRTEQTASTTSATPQPPIETASLSPQAAPPTVEPARVAPTPMPLSMRPPAPTRPTQAASTPPAQAPGLVSTPGFNPQIVIPDTVVTGTVAPPPSGAVVPPAPVPGGDVLIGPADLQDWETGPLSDFIARRQGQNEGYVSGDEWWAGAGNGGSSATYQTWPPREVPRYRVYPLY